MLFSRETILNLWRAGSSVRQQIQMTCGMAKFRKNVVINTCLLHPTPVQLKGMLKTQVCLANFLSEMRRLCVSATVTKATSDKLFFDEL